MTKKNFIALADSIIEHNARIYRNLSGKDAERIAFDGAAIDTLANFCTAQNPHFNRERWLGYIAGTNGANGGKR